MQTQVWLHHTALPSISETEPISSTHSSSASHSVRSVLFVLLLCCVLFCCCIYVDLHSKRTQRPPVISHWSPQALLSTQAQSSETIAAGADINTQRQLTALSTTTVTEASLLPPPQAQPQPKNQKEQSAPATRVTVSIPATPDPFPAVTTLQQQEQQKQQNTTQISSIFEQKLNKSTSSSHNFTAEEIARFEAKYECLLPHREDHIPMLYQLASDFDQVWTEFGLEYSIEDGTLIGALRHGGIVPSACTRQASEETRVRAECSHRSPCCLSFAGGMTTSVSARMETRSRLRVIQC
jgi:hypothetical protein